MAGASPLGRGDLPVAEKRIALEMQLLRLKIAGVQSSFRHAWTSYRRLRFFVVGLFVAFMLELRYLLFLPGLVFGLTFVAYYFSATYLANWKCPRCRQPFFRSSFVRSLFGGKCSHCDLPKWSVTENGKVLAPPKFPFF